jgi:hypothetical protein
VVTLALTILRSQVKTSQATISAAMRVINSADIEKFFC